MSTTFDSVSVQNSIQYNNHELNPNTVFISVLLFKGESLSPIRVKIEKEGSKHGGECV